MHGASNRMFEPDSDMSQLAFRRIGYLIDGEGPGKTNIGPAVITPWRGNTRYGRAILGCGRLGGNQRRGENGHLWTNLRLSVYAARALIRVTASF